MNLTATREPQPHTRALRRALQSVNNFRSVADLLFLEAWEMHRPRDLGATLRAGQIRRANRELSRRHYRGTCQRLEAPNWQYCRHRADHQRETCGCQKYTAEGAGDFALDQSLLR